MKFTGFAWNGHRRHLALSTASALLAATALVAAVPAQAQTDPASVVARVNDQPITEQDVAIATEDLGASFGGMAEAQKRDAIISLLIDVKLVSEAAARQKLDSSPDFARTLAYLREKALMQAYLDKEGKTAVNPAEVKKVYDETMKDMKPEEEVHARHILVESEDDAKKVVDRLKKGEDFAVVAKEVSKDTGSAEEGGDLGFFTKDQMVPEFADTAFKLTPGTLSDPVQSQFGWHVMKVEEKRQKPMPTVDQVRDQIELYLTRRAQQDTIRRLREQAKIERTAAAPPAPAAPAGATPAAPK